MTSKPSLCTTCKLSPYGAGFLSDTYPQRPVTLVRYLLPNEHVQLERHFPDTTSFGRNSREFMSKSLDIPLVSLNNIIGYSYLIRCYLGTVKTATQHLVHLDKKADSALMKEVITCKQLHDKNKYEIIMFSYDFLDTIITPAYKSVVERCLMKAYNLSKKHSAKVGVYMGDKCLEHVFPRLTGGMNKWTGHFVFTGE